MSFDRLEAIIRDRSTWLWRAEAGNLADLMLDVVKAADELFGYLNGRDLGRDWSCHQRICDALAALCAAQDKLP